MSNILCRSGNFMIISIKPNIYGALVVATLVIIGTF